MNLRDVRATSALAAALALGACAAEADRASPPPTTPGRTVTAVADAATDLGVTVAAVDAHGAPRLVQGTRGSPRLAAGTPEEAAIGHVRRLAPLWRVGAGALPALEPAGTIPFAGGHVVRLRQVVDGVDVFGGELRVLVGPGGSLDALGGTLVATDRPRARTRVAIDATDAVAGALADRYGVAVARRELAPVAGAAGARGDGSVFFRAGAPGAIVLEEARARRVWHRDGEHLVPAWMVEAYAARSPDDLDGDAFRALVATDDGRILARTDLEASEAFTYRVFAEPAGSLRPLDGPQTGFTPHPTGVPDGSRPSYVAPVLVTVDGLNTNPDDAADPWLPASATETVGNNADVYVDVASPNGLSEGDFRASVTAPGQFDRVYDVGSEPLASTAQQMAAVTQLFYAGNWLHDFWYDAGFTEAAGNAQADNYGRGGVDGDALRLEAQDGANSGSRNNANMATPSDGMSPRMQVYLWDGPETRSLTVTGGPSPTSTASASFGPQDFDVTGELVAASDGTAMGTQACNPIVTDVAGKVGLVDRGECTFKTKAANLQAAGAIGMVLANHEEGGAPQMGDSNNPPTAITIPSLSVSLTDGAALRTALGAGPVTVTLHRETGVSSDGALDGTLVAHEFGHYLHHRLSLCGTQQCGAMSEGWGDFLSLMLAFDDGDDPQGVYPITVYATGGFGGDPGYFGLRRAPYSVDLAKNALTFRHMADGEALPDHPMAFTGQNSEVHNAGEVWASMLWEGYVALVEASDDVADARARMARYVVAGLLLAPPDATVTETRDAILAATRAASPADHDLLAAAFARRGAGTCAVSPPRDSSDLVGIVESYEVRGRVDVGTAVVADTDASCDDDGVLDAGETVRLTVPIGNGGPMALTDVVVTITSPTAELTITPVANEIASIDAFGAAEATFDVALAAGTAEPIAGELAVEIAATGACQDRTTTTYPLRLNVSDVDAAAATDGFDADRSVWTLAGDGADAVWGRFSETALDRAWRGADLGGPSDAALVSPPVEVSADEPLVVTFTHRHSFEASDGTLWDGAVIEVSTDGGETWQDAATWASPSYAGIVTDQSGNPLGGRPGYGGDNPSYPATDVETLEFGTALAGQTIQLRFRVATDVAVGAPGWEIDDVAFSGIVGTPFPGQVADDGTCTSDDPDAPDDPLDDETGGCCSTGGGGAGSALVGLGVLALVLRRQRRRQ